MVQWWVNRYCEMSNFIEMKMFSLALSNYIRFHQWMTSIWLRNIVCFVKRAVFLWAISSVAIEMEFSKRFQRATYIVKSRRIGKWTIIFKKGNFMLLSHRMRLLQICTHGYKLYCITYGAHWWVHCSLAYNIS